MLGYDKASTKTFWVNSMWLFFALSSAILWGLNYALAERVLNQLSATTLLAFEMGLGALIFGTLAYFGDLSSDWKLLKQNSDLAWLTFFEVSIVTIASACIVFSIQAKNATAAGLIELIYPLFIILFSWLLFGQNHMSPQVVAGGAAIVIGVALLSM